MLNSNQVNHIIKIRPHHGMCIQFFCGEGYSKEFVCGMSEIVSVLNAGAEIELTDCTDSVCAFCPNNLCGGCISDDKVRQFDQSVLNLCDFRFGDVMSWLISANKCANV